MQRWNAGAAVDGTDRIAVEEPLQIVIDGHPVAVVMRTPGDDADLVAGFLFTEGIVRSPGEIARIDLEARDNHALVFLAEGVSLDLQRLTRHLFSASSCGLCGKATIEAIMQQHPAVAGGPDLDPGVLLAAPDRMREAQLAFGATGGLHASAVFDASGSLLVAREDVGRHNALDKAIGRLWTDGRDLANCFLLVSGRISFELMQKALAARIPVVAGISAPSSLAVEFARESRQTLVGFLRPPTLNIYTGGERISS
ncbi:MAG: formate dehydrogenase accessory sulfurtransferase FdhD [Akkermansiaceae bacterium]|nr:formate dehydrogenase accessory sulfurtransferase FdhD [Akkermansiaceae bacterium]